MTPVKNEETFIGELIASIKGQSIPLLLWVIVDDGSTDRTPEILDVETSAIDWIEVIRLPPGEQGRGGAGNRARVPLPG